MSIFQKLFKKEVDTIEKDFKSQVESLQKTKEQLEDVLKSPPIKIITKELRKLKTDIANATAAKTAYDRCHLSLENPYNKKLRTVEQQFEVLLLELEKLNFEV